MTEVTSPEVLKIAARGIKEPSSLSPEEIQSVCASCLTQAAVRPAPDLAICPEPPPEAA